MNVLYILTVTKPLVRAGMCQFSFYNAGCSNVNHGDILVLLQEGVESIMGNN